MERIKEIVERVLSGKAGERDEKDYLALWDEVVPKEIRRHSRVWFKGGRLVVLVDNPTTGHLLFLQREEIVGRFRANRLAIKELAIKQNRGA